MPVLLAIVWLPAAIAFMAITYVLTLGAIQPAPATSEDLNEAR